MLEAGAELGPYRIVGPLGKGGMASVFKVYEPALDRHVALKVLPREFLHDPTFSERFKREAKVIARLEHRHIVPIHGFGIDEGVPWMAMRLFSNTLSGRLSQGPLPREEAVEILAEAAEALDYAHSKGILHRDVKPQNILLDEEGHAYLADFGIAKMLESTVALTQTGVVTGTPQYMSPEQARAEGVDHRTDIYALGIIAYQLFAGDVPFHATTPVGLLMKHVMDPIPVPDVSKVPTTLMQPVLKALAKQKKHRWDTASGFVAALGATPDAAAAVADTPTTDLNLAFGDEPTRALTGAASPKLSPPPPPPAPKARPSATPPATPPPGARQPSMVARMLPGLILAVVVFGLLLAAATVGYFANRRQTAAVGEPTRAADRASSPTPPEPGAAAAAPPTTSQPPQRVAPTRPTPAPQAQATPKPVRRSTPRATPTLAPTPEPQASRRPRPTPKATPMATPMATPIATPMPKPRAPAERAVRVYHRHSFGRCEATLHMREQWVGMRKLSDKGHSFAYSVCQISEVKVETMEMRGMGNHAFVMMQFSDGKKYHLLPVKAPGRPVPLTARDIVQALANARDACF